MWRLLSILLAGCSFLGARGWQTRATVECSRPLATTVLDGAVAALGGVAAIRSGIAPCSGESCIGTGLQALEMGTLGSVAFLSALYGGYELHACRERRDELAQEPAAPSTPTATASHPAPPSPPPDAPLVEAVQARDPGAAQLTRQAHGAALRDQCGGVRAVQDRVRALDSDYYAQVFAVDPAIAECLK